MPRDWHVRIEDILDGIARIQRYLDGFDFERFAKDDRTVDAVIRNLGVIGEAASQIPDTIRAAHPELPWAQMRGLRNLIIHEYFGLSLEILWDTAREDLPPLVPALNKVRESNS